MNHIGSWARDVFFSFVGTATLLQQQQNQLYVAKVAVLANLYVSNDAWHIAAAVRAVPLPCIRLRISSTAQALCHAIPHVPLITRPCLPGDWCGQGDALPALAPASSHPQVA
jgi:hypothetical protein